MSLGPIPLNAPLVDAKGVVSTAWRPWLSQLYQIAQALGTSGSTAQRPVGSTTVPLYVSQMYFDTTLGYPIWVKSLNPTVWVNATGAPV